MGYGIMYSFLNGDVTFIEKLSSLLFWRRSLFINSNLLMKESLLMKTPSDMQKWEGSQCHGDRQGTLQGSMGFWSQDLNTDVVQRWKWTLVASALRFLSDMTWGHQ